MLYFERRGTQCVAILGEVTNCELKGLKVVG